MMNSTPQEYIDAVGVAYRHFRDATPDEPVRAAEYLSHLDLSFADEFLKGLYREDSTLPPQAMVKALVLMDVLKMKYYPETIRHLQTYPEEAALLGFHVDKGVVRIPTRQYLWHFDNVRMRTRWDEFFRLLSNESIATAKACGINAGRELTEDATPVKALKKDNAPYNDHYGCSGYKLDTLVDAKTRFPVAKRVIYINEDEAKCLVPEMNELLDDDIKIRSCIVDNGYSDYPVIAWTGLHGIDLHYRMQENWVHNKKGDLVHLWEVYDKYWEDDAFDPDASIEYVLNFLYERGKIEEVGAYFRNLKMAEHNADPEAYMKRYHRRSLHEGSHGNWKEQLLLEKRLAGKGIEKVDRYLTRNLCSVLAVGLCRLQHGVTERLTSMAGLT